MNDPNKNATSGRGQAAKRFEHSSIFELHIPSASPVQPPLPKRTPSVNRLKCFALFFCSFCLFLAPERLHNNCVCVCAVEAHIRATDTLLSAHFDRFRCAKSHYRLGLARPARCGGHRTRNSSPPTNTTTCCEVASLGFGIKLIDPFLFAPSQKENAHSLVTILCA